MSDSDFFARFRANTLKSMVKWMENPRKTHIASTLQKYIPLDRDRDIRNKKLTNAVKLQLIEIEKLSANQRELMRQIVNNINNLTDNVFIQNVRNAKKGATSCTMNTTHCNTNGQNTQQAPVILMQSIDKTDRILTALTQRMTANTEKLAMLEELSATMEIPVEGKEAIMNELAKNKKEENGWKFRKKILNDVIHKIKKKEQKLLQHKKQMTLQQMMEKMTLSKNKSLCQLTLNLNTINMECESINKQLMKLCTDINTNNMDKMRILQTQKKEKEKEKELISQKISTQNVVIQGIGLLLNEIVSQQPIHIESWYNLSTNNKGNILQTAQHHHVVHKYNGYNGVHSSSALNLPQITPFVSDKNTKKIRSVQSNNGFSSSLSINSTKRKFKRPTRSNAVKAKRLNICDVLPQTLCPMKLSSDFMENGLIRDASKSMFCEENMERNEWINTYNARQIPGIQKKYRSIYGQNISLKPMEKWKVNPAHVQNQHIAVKTCTNAQKHCNQATVRKMEEIVAENVNENSSINTMEMSVDDGEESEDIDDDDEEFINVSDDDMASIQNTSAEPQILHAPSPNIEDKSPRKYTKNGKQSLNIRKSKTNALRAQHHKRNRNKTQHKMDKNHPLLVNDPLNRMQNQHVENETFLDGLCLHYVARGMCKFKENGCEYKHPLKYDAKRFYCIQLGTKGECTRSDCKYGHNLNEIPCRDYYIGHCQQPNCLRNHTLSNEEYSEWAETYANRQKAYRKWREINAKRYETRQVDRYKNNGAMNASVVNDERLHNVAHDSLFDSALIE